SLQMLRIIPVVSSDAMDALLGFLIIGGLILGWVEVDRRWFKPRRNSRVLDRIAHDYPELTALAHVSGLRVDGDEGPAFEQVFAVTNAGVVFCERRQGLALGVRRWDSELIGWPEVRLVINDYRFDTLNIWIGDHEAAGGDIHGFLAAAQAYLVDPSGATNLAE